MTVDTQLDQIAPAQTQPAVDSAVLGNVTDPVAAGFDWLPLDQCGAGAERELAQQHFQQRGFSGSVRPENRDELTGRHLQIEVIPQHPVAEGEPGTGERDNLVNHEY